jgi:hypothetical protein
MTPHESNDLLIRVDQSLQYLVKTQDEMKQQIAHVEAVGEETLSQTTKTNGRVTILEKENEYRKSEISNLRDDISPIKEDIKTHTSIIDVVKGNWKGVVLTIFIILEGIKFIKDIT